MAEIGAKQQMTRSEDRFSAYISELDAAARATLRRSLAFTPGTWPAAFPFVEPWVIGSGSWNRRVQYLCAALQSSSRAGMGRGSLGEAARKLSQVTGSSSVEQRFITLLEADADELPYRLRQMITLLSSADIALDWGQLRHDLSRWLHRDKFVQQRWARDYYRQPDKPDNRDTNRELAAAEQPTQKE